MTTDLAESDTALKFGLKVRYIWNYKQLYLTKVASVMYQTNLNVMIFKAQIFLGYSLDT